MYQGRKAKTGDGVWIGTIVLWLWNESKWKKKHSRPCILATLNKKMNVGQFQRACRVAKK